VVTVTESWAAPITAQDIAAALGERDPGALGELARIVCVLGARRAQAFLNRTRDIETQGGLMTRDGSRRRTPGGVYLHLVKQETRGTPAYAPIFGAPPWKQGGQRSKTPRPVAVWTDEMLVAAFGHLQYGKVNQVKIVVTGRPARVEQQGLAMIVGLRSERAPSLPRELPPAPTGTSYAVFMARRHWAAVAPALKRDPEDILVIEGLPTLHPKFPQGVVVYASMVTTRALQRARKEAQRQELSAGQAGVSS
jgi:hypothetical protein